MAFVLDRLLVVCAGVIAAGALCGCGDDTVAPPATGTEQAKASQPKTAPSTSPTPSGQGVNGFTFFSLPSGNVGCVIHHGEDYVRCDILERSWSPPPRRPSDCAPDPGAYGHGIELKAGDSPRFSCARDTATGGGPLAYGDSVIVGKLRCESAQSGMTCRDVKTGHGFSIAREGYRFF